MTDIKRLTIKDVMEIYSVKSRTVYSWIKSGKLKAEKPTGKNYYITIQALNEFEKGR